MKTRFAFALVVFGLVLNAEAAPRATAAAKSSALPRSEVSTRSSYDSGSPMDGKLEITPNFGFAFISPGDINGVIRDGNDSMQKQGIKSFNVSEFGSTSGFGLTSTYQVMPQLGIGLGFNRLSASTEGSAKVNNNNLTGKYSIGASLLTVESKVTVFRSSDSRFEGLVSPFAGVGFYSGSTEFSGSAMTNGSSEVNSSANGAVFGSTLGGRYWFTRNFSLGMHTGYRFAKSGVLKVNSQKNTDTAVGSQVESNGKKIQLDASSFMVGAQATLAL